MQPIDKVLNRIKGDREFGNALFEIGYYDRMAVNIFRRPFIDLIFEQDTFLLMEEGVYQRFPYTGASEEIR